MNRASITLPLLLALAVCAAAQTSPASMAACEPLVQEAMELSGANDMLRQIPGLIEGQLQSRLKEEGDLDPAGRQAVAQMVRSVFDAQEFGSQMRAGLLQGCKPERMAAVVQQLRDPLMQRMRALEARVNTAQGMEELQAYATRLQMIPPARERVELLMQMDAALKLTESQVQMMESMLRGMTVGFGTPASAQQLGDLRERMTPALRNRVLLIGLFTYRTASNEQLEDYIAMNERQPLRGFLDAIRSTFHGALERQAQKASAQMKQALDQRSRQAEKKPGPG